MILVVCDFVEALSTYCAVVFILSRVELHVTFEAGFELEGFIADGA